MEGCLTWCWQIFLMLWRYRLARQLKLNQSAVFINVMLELSIPHLVSRQEVYLKNSVDWELVIRDVQGLNWNEIIRSPWPASSLNEVLSRVISDRVPKWTIVVKTGDKPWFGELCVLVHRAKHLAYRVWSCIVKCRLIGKSIGWLVVVLSWSMKTLNEHSQNGASYSWRMHQIYGSCGLQWRQWLLTVPHYHTHTELHRSQAVPPRHHFLLHTCIADLLHKEVKPLRELIPQFRFVALRCTQIEKVSTRWLQRSGESLAVGKNLHACQAPYSLRMQSTFGIYTHWKLN